MKNIEVKGMLTPFGEKLDADCPLPEYPRPQLVRSLWQNLNGKWEYRITKKGEQKEDFDGIIIVPFSPETVLSGVEKQVMPDDVLTYKRTFDFVKTADRAILRFGAVDYRCLVEINGHAVGKHRGGYTPFCFDITDYVREGENEIVVKVTDPSDSGVQATGKQHLDNKGIWYTAQSGIWQTVWIEQVTQNYIENVLYTPDIDTGCVRVDLVFCKKEEGFIIDVEYEEGKVKRFLSSGQSAIIDIGDVLRLWSPEDPFLYKVHITTESGDVVDSYFGMRKISTVKEGKHTLILLNNKPYFQKGLLDQGYWPDGLYTPPSDEAMVYDIQEMKEYGFNMLRKHIKIEPLRWYYHCDRLGMLVWQDMVSGCDGKAKKVGKKFRVNFNGYEKRTGYKKFITPDTAESYVALGRGDESGRKEYEQEIFNTISLLYNQPSIVLWTIFNESWGQFDAKKMAEKAKEYDPTRLIDHASGWYDQGGGDVISLHNYSKRPWFTRLFKGDERALVLSEYGGLTYKYSEVNTYKFKHMTGYRSFRNELDCTKAFVKIQERLCKAIQKEGLCATVYTQVSDVESELNGILTYDRKKEKLIKEMVKAVNDKLTM